MGEAVWYISKYVSPPTTSSVGSRGYHLMKELSKKELKVIVITSDSNPFIKAPKLNQTYKIIHDENLLVCWIKTLKYLKAKSLRRVLSWLEFEIKLFFFPFYKIAKPKIIIVSSLSLLTIINGLYLKYRYKAKLVFEIRDIWPLTIIEEGGFSEKNLLVRFLSLIERIGYAKSDLIVGTMPNLKQHVHKVAPCSPAQIACVPMGFDPALLKKQQPLDPDKQALLPKGKFIVGYAGTIGRTNALETLFICARLLEHYDNIHFIIAGDGDLREKFQSEYSNLKNVTFVGKVTRVQVQDLLEKFDLLYLSVYKSKVWEYGQSLNKLIDYMLAGKPIVASYSGYPSMINEANCGAFIPAEDPQALKDIILLYSRMNVEELRIIGQRGQKWILENRSYTSLASDYYLLFKNLL